MTDANFSPEPPISPEADSRRSMRHRLVLPVRVTVGELTHDGVVLDISTNGCLIELNIELQPQEALTIDLPIDRGSTLQAEVVWNGDDIFGCQFSSPLPTPIVHEARLRGAPLLAGRMPDDASTEQLAVAIGTARRRSGLSATELARRTGVSRPTLWSWETGKTRPSDTNLHKLREVLAASGEVSGYHLQDDRSEDASEGLSVESVIARHKQALAKDLGIASEMIEIRITL